MRSHSTSAAANEQKDRLLAKTKTALKLLWGVHQEMGQHAASLNRMCGEGSDLLESLDESTEAVAVPRSAIVFVLGGVTYEEARLVHALNMEAGSTTRVTLGGEFVTSARQFLRTLG